MVAKIGSWRKGRLLTRPGRPGSLRYLSGDVKDRKEVTRRRGDRRGREKIRWEEPVLGADRRPVGPDPEL